MHEIHRPDLIDGMRHAQSLGLVTNQPLAGLDAQIELQFPVDTEVATLV